MPEHETQRAAAPPSVADLLATLAEAGLLLEARIADGADAAAIAVERPAAAAGAPPGTLAFADRPGRGAAFGGALLVATEAAARGVEPTSARCVAIVANPRLATVVLAHAFYLELARDRPAAFADAASAASAEAARAWVMNATVGAGVAFGPFAVVGAAGMTNRHRPADGRVLLFPHFGTVEIGDDVELATHVSVQRGLLDVTRIGDASRIGPHANIGHGAQIGRDVHVSAHVQIGGSVAIGDGAKVWQGAIVKNGVRIGAGAVVGMGSVIKYDVPDGEVWSGNPARRFPRL